jgi:quercetin dioxygenase-like cupin family protein
MLLRREFLQVAGSAGAVAGIPSLVNAQTPPAGPKLTQLLRKDLIGQPDAVQESVVSLVEFGPGAAAPWHMHPAAQEILYVQEGNVTIEVEGQGISAIKAGEAAIIPAEIPHLAKNDSTSMPAKAVVIHSRSAKDKPLLVVVKR